MFSNRTALFFNVMRNCCVTFNWLFLDWIWPELFRLIASDPLPDEGLYRSKTNRYSHSQHPTCHTFSLIVCVDLSQIVFAFLSKITESSFHIFILAHWLCQGECQVGDHSFVGQVPHPTTCTSCKSYIWYSILCLLFVRCCVIYSLFSKLHSAFCNISFQYLVFHC